MDTIANNVATDSTGHFTYPWTAPDLLQNNSANDSQPSFNNIVFQAKDNVNGHVYNTTSYTEYCRGLTQVATQTAGGMYGNNTNLATTAFVENGQAISISGAWFNPGTATFPVLG